MFFVSVHVIQNGGFGCFSFFVCSGIQSFCFFVFLICSGEPDALKFKPNLDNFGAAVSLLKVVQIIIINYALINNSSSFPPFFLLFFHFLFFHFPSSSSSFCVCRCVCRRW